MKIGVFDHFDADGGSLAALYEWRLKLVEAYDRIGIDIYHLAEHHSTPLGMAPSPSVFLSAVAQRTKWLRFGPMVYTLSLHHPLRVMEEICMLDQMSGGRIELGVGRGISPLESSFYGVDPKQSRDIYVEVLDILLKAFQTQSLDHEGKFYRFKDTPIVIAPLQKPYPPLWYGVLAPEGADWPARQAMNIATNALVPATREITDRYRVQWRTAGRDPAKLPLLGMSRHIVIAETDSEALATARRCYARWYESFTHLWRLHGVAPISAAYPDTVEGSMEIGMSFVGAPATVRAKLGEAIEATGVNYLMLRFAFGDMNLAEALRSVELFAREVRPALPAA
ncbi:MAG TPA: LLM class flavin-dependent oxidoreductase [Stellaceae bacterium]|jgi:alkanesulfonate monooxygenase SsuD/methylene tetrahydromethanopterin reductase-like flavin-dependent oxidoreductase (luciferase family)